MEHTPTAAELKRRFRPSRLVSKVPAAGGNHLQLGLPNGRNKKRKLPRLAAPSPQIGGGEHRTSLSSWSKRANLPLSDLGNWPLNTRDRWMRELEREIDAEYRAECLRNVQEGSTVQSSDSSDTDSDESTLFDGTITSYGNDDRLSKTMRNLMSKRRLRKERDSSPTALRATPMTSFHHVQAAEQIVARLRKREFVRSRERRQRFETSWEARLRERERESMEEHADICEKTVAAAPKLLTRAELRGLKRHNESLILGQIAKSWTAVAAAYGVPDDRQVDMEGLVDDAHISVLGLKAVLMGESIHLDADSVNWVLLCLGVQMPEGAEGASAPATDEDTISRSHSYHSSGSFLDDVERSLLERQEAAAAGWNEAVPFRDIFNLVWDPSMQERIEREAKLEGRLQEEQRAFKAVARGRLVQKVQKNLTALRMAFQTPLLMPSSAGTASGSAPNEKPGPFEVLSRQECSLLRNIIENGRACLNGSSCSGSGEKMAETRTLRLHDAMAALEACASNPYSGTGKGRGGFEGLTPERAVALVRRYAIERIQAIWRGSLQRHQFRPKLIAITAALERQREKLKTFIRALFYTWAKSARYSGDLKQLVLPRLKEWARWTAQRREKMALFRGTYWPLYVWRRWVNQRKAKRDKANMLRRVWGALTCIRHFRAWAHHVQSATAPLKRSAAHQIGVVRSQACHALRHWQQRSRKRRALSRAWFRYGIKLRGRMERKLMAKVAVAWRYLVFAQVECTRRSTVNFRSIFVLGEMKRRKRLHAETRVRALAAGSSAPPSLDLPPIHVRGHPNLLQFPSVFDSRGRKLAESVRGEISISCARIQSTYEEKEKLLGFSNFLLYQRLGSALVNALEDNLSNIRGRRFAAEHYALVLKHKFLREWGRTALRLRLIRDGVVDEEDRGVSKGKLFISLMQEGISSDVASSGSSDSPSMRESSTAGEIAAVSICQSSVDSSQQDSQHFSLGSNENVLEYDRSKRDEQLEYAKLVANQSRSRIRRQLGIMLKTQRAADAHVKVQKLRDDEIKQVMDDHAAHAGEICERLQYSAKHFKEHAAIALIDAVTRVWEQVDSKREKQVMKGCFRSWHLRRLQAASVSLYNRACMRNWLRICVRLRRMDQAMPRFWKVRTKLAVWRRWLGMIRVSYTFTKPDLVTDLKRKRAEAAVFDLALGREGIVAGHYDPAVLIPLCTTHAMIFARWRSYAANRNMRRRLVSEIRLRHRVRFLRKIFTCWKSGLGAEIHAEARYEFRERPFEERQAGANIEAMRRLFIASSRKSVSRMIRQRHTFRSAMSRQLALRTPSFKKFIAWMEYQAKERLRLEMRLLSDAFTYRNSVQVMDSPSCIAGRKDGAAASSFNTCENIPCGFLVSSVRIATKVGLGVTGISLSLSGAEGSIDLPWCGPGPSGRSTHVHHFAVQTPSEKLCGVQVVFGDILERICFITSAGTTSPWYGERLTSTAVTVSLPSALAEGSDPHRHYVIGLAGASAGGQILSLRLLMRKVEGSTVLSHMWPGPDDLAFVRSGGSWGRSASESLPGSSSSKAASVSGSIASRSVQRFRQRRDNETKSQDESRKPVTKIRPEEEFAHILRMRHTDGHRAIERSLRLARRLWEQAGRRKAKGREFSDIELEMPMQRECMGSLNVIMGLVSWHFSAVCPHLPKNTSRSSDLERLEENAAACAEEGDEALAKAAKLRWIVHEKGLALDERVRHIAMSGMSTPAERQRARQDALELEDLEKEAQKEEVRGNAANAKAVEIRARVRAMLPTIPLTRQSIDYYRAKRMLGKTEMLLEAQFGKSFFRKQGVDSVLAESGVLDGTLFEQLKRSLEGNRE